MGNRFGSFQGLQKQTGDFVRPSIRMNRRTPSRVNRVLYSWPVLTEVRSNSLELPSLADLAADFIDRFFSGSWRGSFQSHSYSFDNQIVNARFQRAGPTQTKSERVAPTHVRQPRKGIRKIERSEYISLTQHESQKLGLGKKCLPVCDLFLNLS